MDIKALTYSIAQVVFLVGLIVALYEAVHFLKAAFKKLFL